MPATAERLRSRTVRCPRRPSFCSRAIDTTAVPSQFDGRLNPHSKWPATALYARAHNAFVAVGRWLSAAPPPSASPASVADDVGDDDGVASAAAGDVDCEQSWLLHLSTSPTPLIRRALDAVLLNGSDVDVGTADGDAESATALGHYIRAGSGVGLAYARETPIQRTQRSRRLG
jgi:hypothetical protein